MVSVSITSLVSCDIFDGSDGVLRFKQNFNGYIVRKMGTFRYYPQPFKYKAIQGIKKLLGRS
ncbi:MAG: peptidoglycan bridge formation glycyltransferase FemA/FemB family protein [Streptococcus salivarius]